MQSTLWGKVLNHAREAHEHFVLFFDRDGGGVSIFPAVRRATIPDKDKHTMPFAAESGPCAAIARSLSSGF
eukprot:8518848-Pyramimonas_sp.AAC.1